MAPTAKTSTASIATGRMRSITRVLWGILFLNLAVAFAKYLWGLVTKSASMQADGIHSIFDSAGNVVGIVGITLAARPADDGHPYGHAKFETYGSVIIGVLLLGAAVGVASSAVSELLSGDYGTQVNAGSFVVMVGTLCVNLGVTAYERKRAKELRSDILDADASHTLSDALVSIGVIVGLALVQCGIPIADPLMALLVSVAILHAAYDVFRKAVDTLSDHARIPEADVANVALSVDGVKHVHKVRTRGTEAEVYVDMHVLVDPDMTVLAAHTLADAVERAVIAKFPQVAEVLVHIEPDDGHIE